LRVLRISKALKVLEGESGQSHTRQTGTAAPQVTENMVDVSGLEPPTPCLQIQKTNLEAVKKTGKE
jgi:hypothetical protein